MNPELSALIDLQKVNSKIGALRERLDVLPRELEQLEQSAQAARQELEAARQGAGELEQNRRQAEKQAEVLRERLSKYKSQLMEVRTNKEYQAALHEIATTEGEISKAEDVILECMLELDENREQLSLLEKETREKEAEIAGQRKELEAVSSEARSEISELEQQQRQLLGALPAELKALYDRIAAVRSGMAMAEARDQSCQVCHVRLRPQLFSEIKLNERIITCENCNRILYYAGN